MSDSAPEEDPAERNSVSLTDAGGFAGIVQNRKLWLLTLGS